MNNSCFIRKKYQFNSCVKETFKIYGVKALIIFGIYFIGIILGFCIVSQLGEDITSDIILDRSFLDFLGREIIYTNLFINYLLTYTLLLCYSIFINRATFWHILNICIVFIIGFCFGYNLGIYFKIFNIIAIILVILVIILFNLIINFLYSLILAIVWVRNREIKKFGKWCTQACTIKTNNLFIILTILIIILLFLQCLLCNLFLMFVVL